MDIILFQWYGDLEIDTHKMKLFYLCGNIWKCNYFVGIAEKITLFFIPLSLMSMIEKNIQIHLYQTFDV